MQVEPKDFPLPLLCVGLQMGFQVSKLYISCAEMQDPGPLLHPITLVSLSRLPVPVQ